MQFWVEIDNLPLFVLDASRIIKGVAPLHIYGRFLAKLWSGGRRTCRTCSYGPVCVAPPIIVGVYIVDGYHYNPRRAYSASVTVLGVVCLSDALFL